MVIYLNIAHKMGKLVCELKAKLRGNSDVRDTIKVDLPGNKTEETTLIDIHYTVILLLQKFGQVAF